MKKTVACVLMLGLIWNGIVQSQSWTMMKVPELSGKWALTGIHFPSANIGFAVGYNYDDVGFAKAQTKGIIIHYVEGNWVKSDFPSPADDWTLHGVWFLNDDEGWAFGKDKTLNVGLLMNYKNGIWSMVALPKLDSKDWVLYDVYFQNAEEGWAVGGSQGKDKPILLHYVNGEWNPEPVTDFKKQTLLSIHGNKQGLLSAGGFREGQFGSAGAGRATGSFIMTRDKEGWQFAKLPMLSNNVICRDIVCLDDNSIYAAGWMPAFQNAPETGKLLTLSGKKWTEVSVSIDAKEWNLMALAFESKDAGWAVGNYPGKDKGLFVEFSKGKWTALSKKSEPLVGEKWMLRSICFDGNGAYYAAGCDQKSNNGLIFILKR